MSRIIKPSAPLKSGEDYIMPVTTVDQIRDNRGQFTNVAMVDTTGADVTTEATAVKFGSDVIVDGRLGATQGELNKGISNFNILDNPFFTINQRGQTSYNNGGYCVDRWCYSVNETITVNADGITITSNNRASDAWLIFQRTDEVERFAGKTLTLSAITSEGLMVHTFDVPNPIPSSNTSHYSDYTGKLRFLIQISSSGMNMGILEDGFDTVSIKAVKLEYGSISTLVNDSAPNYQTELLKCMRYFQPFRALTVSMYGRNSDYNWYTTFLLPVPMRRVPVISNVTISNYTGISESQCAVSAATAESIRVSLKTSGTTPQHAMAYVSFDASADL